MSTEAVEIRVAGLAVQIVRKDIKNLHLGVYPPNGRVRVAVPLAVSDEAVRLAVIGRLGWIKRQRARFAAQHRQSAREMVSGESHYFLGRRFRLRVIVDSGASKVVLRNKATLDLYVHAGADTDTRRRVLLRWYRKELRALVTRLLAKWQPVVGVRVADWRIKKMKTKWGSCNSEASRVWFNLELAKKPARCLEYVVVHELVHLLEPHHTVRFRALLDEFMPRWRMAQEELKNSPLSHEEWQE
jgi:predicted metal-dependent hydrolase